MLPTPTTGALVAITGPYPLITAEVAVAIGGPPAKVEYAGACPGAIAGCVQINARIPDSAPSGNQAIALSIGSQVATGLATVAIQ
jgi:uncharacterized protein (TIGR03437 family)